MPSSSIFAFRVAIAAVLTPLVLSSVNVGSALADGASVKLKPPAQTMALMPLTPKEDKTVCPATTRLQGKAEVAQTLYTNYNEWLAAQFYKQGVSALQVNNFPLAAQNFKRAGDGFGMSPYDGRFFGESRYAEAQCCRLLRQFPRAAQLYGEAVAIFNAYDPHSPYLKAAADQLALLSKSNVLKGKTEQFHIKLKPLPPKMDRVPRNIALKGKAIELADGTSVATLKDEDFFNGGNLLARAAAVNVSDAFVHNKVYKAFIEMNCLEFTDLGGNYYTAPDYYKAFKSGGKTVVVGASDDFLAPSIRLTINGQQCTISMDLPGFNKASKNALVVTDGERILAIDPRTAETWKLVASFTKKVPEFTWSKLTHIKKPAPLLSVRPRVRSKAVSLFVHSH